MRAFQGIFTDAVIIKVNEGQFDLRQYVCIPSEMRRTTLGSANINSIYGQSRLATDDVNSISVIQVTATDDVNSIYGQSGHGHKRVLI